jgi:hypothetical protein
MPAATVMGYELFIPNMGIATTSCAASMSSPDTPLSSLPKTNTAPSGSSASQSPTREGSRSKTTSFWPAARARSTRAAGSGSSTSVS